jgi:hypothetical protein
MTNLKVTNSGLSVGEVYLVSDGQRLQTNKFTLGQVVIIQLEGVEGFVTKDDMVFPGASLVVVDKDGNVVLEHEDLFEAYNETGVKAEDAKLLSAKLTVGNPMEAGKEYTFTTVFWDKNSEGNIECTLGYSVVE